MELFKRVLLSLFPSEIINQPINPVSMFVSFISAKQYFFVINRKIVENYKLNMFEVSLDSFDVKVGFGQQPDIKMKNIDFYYSYGVSANLNGYRFFSPSAISNSLCLVSSLYLADSFKKHNPNYFSSFLLTTFLFSFIMISRLKVFPQDNEKQTYSRFIDLFFNFYKFVIVQGKGDINEEEFNQLKNDILQNIQVFFMLYYTYKKLNNVFEAEGNLEKEFYSMMFYDELKSGPYTNFVGDFVNNFNYYRYNPKISLIDEKLFDLVFPADILIKLIFDGQDLDMVINYIISGIFDKSILDDYMASFLKGDDKIEQFLYYVGDYKLYKENYFAGLKKMAVFKFKNTNNYDIEEEMDELMSAVGEGEGAENIKIPERIKKESALMERFINFYVMFIGSFWLARGDNFYVRLFRKKILNSLIDPSNMLEMKDDTLFFYGGLLYNYSKNIFYYKSAFDNVKAGKEKFNMPFVSDFKEVHSNTFILKLFNENFVNTLLQDINGKDIKIYIKNKEILNTFKKHYFPRIQNLIKDNLNLPNKVYSNISNFMGNLTNFHTVVSDNLTLEDISNIKESLYTYDLWLWLDLLEQIQDQNINLKGTYSDYSILGILSIFRDTLLGIVLYINYLLSKQKDYSGSLNISLLLKVYLYDVVGISDKYLLEFNKIIDKIIIQNETMALKWLELDDNASFFKIGYDNWIGFIQSFDGNPSSGDISGEDIIWFRGYLKNITFYNKRFLIPKD